MFTFFRDFRWFSLFRDRQERTSSDVDSQYRASAPSPEQWPRSRSQSGRYPEHFNISGRVDSEPRHGHTSYPSKENPRAYLSQFQDESDSFEAQNRNPPQFRPQFQAKHQPQHRIPPQPQTNQADEPYFYPNDSGNPDPTPYYRHRPSHRHHPQDRPQNSYKPGFSDANTPFDQSYLTPQSVQPSYQQAWTPFSMPQTTEQTNGRLGRSRSAQRANTAVQAASTSHFAPRRSSSSAPQIRSRMLKIPLIYPLVCGHRHSLIPDQIPETDTGKSERSVWDSRHFSLPQGSQAPMMIDAVQVCSLKLDWDITLPPSFAQETAPDGQVFIPPQHLDLPLIHARFKSEVCIKTRQDNPLTQCFLRWGCIVVQPRNSNGTPPTMKQFLYDIWEYFHTALTQEDCILFAKDGLAQMVENRAENYARGRGPTRRDVLWGYTRFAGLEVCPRFADTGDLFLYLEPL